MLPRAHCLFLSGGWLPSVLWFGIVPVVTAEPPPHFDHRARQLEVAPAGDAFDVNTPADRPLVVVWFGPSDPTEPVNGDLWRAAKLAFDEANATERGDGRRVELRPCWAENPWGAGVARLFRLVYDEPVVAILGSVDGPATHLAEQVVAKARLPLVSPVSGDASVNFAGVPWMFSCAPADSIWAPLLVGAIVEECHRHSGPLVLVNATDHDSRQFARTLLAALQQRGSMPARRLEFTPGGDLFEVQLRALATLRPAVLALVADAENSAAFLRGLGRRDLHPAVFGGPEIGRRRFFEQAGSVSAGVRFPAAWPSPGSEPERAAFQKRFRGEAGHAADEAALRTYDAARLLIAALRRGGSDRVAVRRALVELGPWPGLAGEISFDGLGRNAAAKLHLTTSRAGRIAAKRAQGSAEAGPEESGAPGCSQTQSGLLIHSGSLARPPLSGPSSPQE